MLYDKRLSSLKDKIIEEADVLGRVKLLDRIKKVKAPKDKNEKVVSKKEEKPKKSKKK